MNEIFNPSIIHSTIICLFMFFLKCNICYGFVLLFVVSNGENVGCCIDHFVLFTYGLIIFCIYL